MRIGIDARLYGIENAGIGRYVTNLIDCLIKIDHDNEYILFLKEKFIANFDSIKNVKIVVTKTPIYSISEQLILPFIYTYYKLDVLHVPHFNAPILYPGKIVVTIHDLIKHDSKGPETTTKSRGLYFLKRLGYLLLIKLIIIKSRTIITPSLFIKNDLVARLRVSDKKITVAHEAVASSIKQVVLSPAAKREVLQKYNLTQPFIVYTGSLYPHKNVDFLVESIVKHNHDREVDLQLAVICARSVFWDRFIRRAREKGYDNVIKMLGFIDDTELSKVYSLALALVHPSKLEGFGLTGLEAMSSGLPVLSSNSSCLPEIYGEAALYFDPNNMEDLVEKLSQIIKNQELRKKLILSGHKQNKKYSWIKMSRTILMVYKKELSDENRYHLRSYK